MRIHRVRVSGRQSRTYAAPAARYRGLVPITRLIPRLEAGGYCSLACYARAPTLENSVEVIALVS